MTIRTKTTVFLAAAFLFAGVACSKKKESSSSGSEKKAAKDDEDDDLEDGDETETETCLTDCATDTGTEDAPQSEFFEELFTPTLMKPCVDGGHVFLRCTNVCSDIKAPAKFKCDRAGIVAQFANVEGFKADFESYVDDKKYFIDQCGVTAAGKAFVALSCYTKGDGECVAKEDVDSKDASVESHLMSTDPAIAGLCDASATP